MQHLNSTLQAQHLESQSALARELDSLQKLLSYSEVMIIIMTLHYFTVNFLFLYIFCFKSPFSVYILF